MSLGNQVCRFFLKNPLSRTHQKSFRFVLITCIELQVAPFPGLKLIKINILEFSIFYFINKIFMSGKTLLSPLTQQQPTKMKFTSMTTVLLALTLVATTAFTLPIEAGNDVDNVVSRRGRCYHEDDGGGHIVGEGTQPQQSLSINLITSKVFSSCHISALILSSRGNPNPLTTHRIVVLLGPRAFTRPKLSFSVQGKALLI